MLEIILKANKWFATLAVVIVLLCAVVLYVMTSISAVVDIINAPTATDWSPSSVKVQAVKFLKIVDMFLVCIGLQVIALGIYKFFVNDQVSLPAAIDMESFAELKLSLVLISSLLLIVMFVEQALKLGPCRELLEYGIAIAAILIAASWGTKKQGDGTARSPKDPPD